MEISKLWLPLVLCLLLAACSDSEKRAPARLRVGEFLAGPAAATVTISGPDSATLALDYGTLTDYRTLPAGTYEVRVTASGQSLLQETVGLGVGGAYTLLIAGIPLEGQSRNQTDFGTRLHRIFEGAAARTTNAFLPQFYLQNDYFVPVPGRGNLRITHLAPGLIPVDVGLHRNGERQVTLSGIGYAHASNRERYAYGGYTAEVHPSGSPLSTLRFPVELDTVAFYNYYLVPDTTAGERLRVVVGRTGR